jgi:hypothetical protein
MQSRREIIAETVSRLFEGRYGAIPYKGFQTDLRKLNARFKGTGNPIPSGTGETKKDPTTISVEMPERLGWRAGRVEGRIPPNPKK